MENFRFTCGSDAVDGKQSTESDTERIMIMWQAILLSLLLSYGSCDIFEDAIQIAFYKTVEAAKANLTNKGIFRNCAPTEATFFISWDPDPLVKGKSVTIEGNYTFPEDFVTGTMDISASIFSDKYPIKCKDIWSKPCKKGETAYKKQQMLVPEIAPAGFSFHLTAKLTNDQTEHEIMCAEADVRVQEDKDTKLRWFIRH